MGSRPDRATHIVLAGGGHSHVEVLRQFGMHPDPAIRLTLISKDYHAPYSGMLPGFIAGHYDYDDSHIDIAPLARFAGCRFFHDSVTGIDLDSNEVHCASRPPVPFDLLSINTGSTPSVAGVSGAREFALRAKPVDRFIEGWREIRARALQSERPFRFLTVGGGAGGVELTLTMRHFLLSREPSASVEFHLATDSGTLLPTHNEGVQRRMQRAADERGIVTYFNHRAVQVSAEAVAFENGATISYDALIWVTQASPPDWLANTALALNERGFIAIRDTLQSTSHDHVFAAGDVASLASGATAKSGVFAVREGPVLYENLRRAASGQALEAYRPQKRFLSLISTGDKNAIASRGKWSLEGAWVWRWKDRIDTKWMAKYRELPTMTPSPASMDGPMHCGGCGCKLGGDVLDRVLSRLSETAPELVPQRLDDASVSSPPPGLELLQTVDFFRSFIDDPYVFGQITAHHCLNDILAMGGNPREALAIVTLPYVDGDYAESLLFDLLSGAMGVLADHGAKLTGGHTTEGPELVFGLSVTGYGEQASLLRSSGMRPGDRLILTKPLGTGAIFAGVMQGQSKGRWIEGAVKSMLLSNAVAAKLAREHGATACTDVTGFGLAGHLYEMTRASGCAAQIDLAAIPTLDGFDALARSGVLSTLHEPNRRRVSGVLDVGKESGDVRVEALFDPQTAGGLLVAVPESKVDGYLHWLENEGVCGASTIGSAVSGDRANTTILVR